MSLPNRNNLNFVERLRHRYGPTRVANDPMAAAYAGMHIWARAVEATQSDQVVEIRKAMVNQPFQGPEGPVNVDAGNRHAWRNAMIGRVGSDLKYEIVWNSPKPIAPEPFPASRSREQWQAFQADLYKQWNGHWRPNSPAKRP
jgi:urea transport system substrate-binding protein